MKAFKYVIKDAIGIHARPAGVLAKEVKRFPGSVITLRKGDKTAEAGKLMRVMSMGVKCGDEITVTVEGGDENAAVAAMEKFFKENL